jgi:alpha-glucosidase
MASAMTTDPARNEQLAQASLPWWKRGPIYHIYPRSFSDSNGDGIGDLRGIIEKLDYLNDGSDRSLGVKAIWLSPIYVSPGRDLGYDVADHTAIDPAFGEQADFDELVAACSERGIRLILDLVLNHTSDLHPWFLESRASTNSARRDWYVWWRGKKPPNNWRSFFGGPAWTYDEDTGEWYLHTFLPEQPDLNWHNPAVREACLDVVRFWLERGVSGFRLDVFNAYFKHPELRDNPWRPGRTAWSRQRHLYNKDRPELHEFLIELRALLDEFPDAMAVGETFDGQPELAASYCDKLHMAFNFDFLAQPWQPAAIQRSIARWDRLLESDETWPCYVLSNHDNPRHAWRYGRGVNSDEANARAKVAAALLLTLRGTPFIYYGEEIGMQDVAISRSQAWDVAFDGSSRDTSRTPMHWSGDTHAGFSEHRPWLPLSPDYRDRNVAEQLGDPHSVLSFYRKLIALREEVHALLYGSWEPLLRRPREALVYLRKDTDGCALVVLNFSAETLRVDLDDPLPAKRWTPRVSTRRAALGWEISMGRTLRVAPYEATVFTRS